MSTRLESFYEIDISIWRRIKVIDFYRPISHLKNQKNQKNRKNQKTRIRKKIRNLLGGELSSNKFEEGECVICLDTMFLDTITCPECKISTHIHCMNKSLKNSPTCVHCRSDKFQRYSDLLSKLSLVT
jgi:hypothetical protein